ncbi:TIM44-like domain-containing protein [Planctomycetota bacterium]|nr:TIM44-like domain-containing protein [Planctomycetota bacterium]
MEVSTPVGSVLLQSDGIVAVCVIIFLGLFGLICAVAIHVTFKFNKAQMAELNLDVSNPNDAWATIFHERDTYLQLAAVDPDFSRVPFLEFAHLVLVKYHESRGGLGEGKNRFAVTPYLSPTLANELRDSTTGLEIFVVCSTRLFHVRTTRKYAFANVMYRALLTESDSAPMLVTQTVRFRRPRQLRTRRPEKVLELGCPNCGSASETALDGSCPQCGSVAARGDLDWQAIEIKTIDSEWAYRPEIVPVADIGSSHPTWIAEDLIDQRKDLEQRDSQIRWDRLAAKMMFTFKRIVEGFSALDEKALRPFESDALYDSHRFHIQRRREAEARELYSEVHVESAEIVKVENDRWYDAVTARIFASVKVQPVNKKGDVVDGKPSFDRRYSEYWTFARRAGVTSDYSKDEASCPNCGADLRHINRVGICENCASKIVHGEFDWVATMITKDEEYIG